MYDAEIILGALEAVSVNVIVPAALHCQYAQNSTLYSLEAAKLTVPAEKKSDMVEVKIFLVFGSL